MQLRWWEPLPEETMIEDMLQFSTVLNKEVILLKSGHASIVFSVSGKDYTGISEEDLKKLHALRSTFARSLASYINVTVHSKRIKEEDEIYHKENLHGVEIAEAIDKQWAANFEESYRTRHYVVLNTTSATMLHELANSNTGVEKKDRQLIHLEEAARIVESKLFDYKPRKLSGDDLLSFWASFLNGREVRQKFAGFFNDLIGGSHLLFPNGKKFQVFENTQDRYAGWIGIKSYDNDSTDQLIEELLRQKIEFTIYQQWRAMPIANTKRMVSDKERMAKSFLRSSDLAVMEVTEVNSRLEAGELTFCKYVFSIQVFANSEAQLDQNVDKLSAIVSHYGYQTVRETLNIEPLFWSILPGLEHLSIRKRELTNENIADFASFSTIGEGLSTSSSWGDTYITKFLTAANTEYRFTFHEDEKPQSLGHTLIVGGSNSGKTTVMSFINSQALKFSNLKVILFDKLHGQHVFTKMHDGNYSDFGEDVSTNPFQMPDTPANREFLAEMIKSLAGDIDIDEEMIRLAIRDNYENLSKDERSLDNLHPSFGLATKGSLAGALRPYLSSGPDGHYFNGKRDSLNFETSRITAFNMDRLFDNPKMLAINTLYMFYRIRQMAMPSKTNRENTPHLIFVDELVKYIADPTFGKKIKEVVLEHRKLDGVFVGAIQNAKDFVDVPAGESILGSMANFIFFPDNKADENVLCRKFQLTKEEFEWVKTSTDPRRMLLKKNKGESVILNVDLAPLGKYLKVFDSSAAAVNRLETMIEEGRNFKKEFLG